MRSSHTRMATESDVDIKSAHPYWAFPYNDISVVHNGQITDYYTWRSKLERKGYRFLTYNDSELIAVWVSDRMKEGLSLEQAQEYVVEVMRQMMVKDNLVKHLLKNA